jgi:ubiquinone/menaquinone biosynthesis C-methylase UbiE
LTPDPDDLKEFVRLRYAEVAHGKATCGSLCGCTPHAEELALAFGYSSAELQTLPEGTNLGLSCGNPQVVAELQPGQSVLDLGSGAGFDAVLAARKVAPGGRVVGVDMTDAMLERARQNASSAGIANVEFRKGDIESLPLDDGTFDVVLSNCVLNLCPDKDRALYEIHRVLKSSGKLAISDMAWTTEPPESVRSDLNSIVGCVGGALVLDDYLRRLDRAGFRVIHLERHPETARLMVELSGSTILPGIENLLSVNIVALKRPGS